MTIKNDNIEENLFDLVGEVDEAYYL